MPNSNPSRNAKYLHNAPFYQAFSRKTLPLDSTKTQNLEAVQGDERDVIFISVGYGVAPNQSRPFLNFGPVSREGGDRRLNVQQF